MSYFLRNGKEVSPADVSNVKSIDRASARIWVNCHRCCGKGIIAHFMHVEGGICFACGNSRGRNKIVPCYSAAKLAKLVVSAEKREAKKAAKADAARLDSLNKAISLVGDNLWVDIKEFCLPLENEYGLNKYDALILELYSKACNGGLSEKAADLLVKVWGNKIKWADEKAEKDANAVDVPEGRYAVTGEVLSVKEYFGDYGTVYKMLVDCGEYRVFGSVPAAIRRVGPVAELEGRSVSFSAAFAPKEKGFGFFSRPSKAELLKEIV
jgi:hypothetical protein